MIRKVKVYMRSTCSSASRSTPLRLVLIHYLFSTAWCSHCDSSSSYLPGLKTLQLAHNGLGVFRNDDDYTSTYQQDDGHIIKVRGSKSKQHTFKEEDFNLEQQCAYVVTYGSYQDNPDGISTPTILDYELFDNYHSDTNGKVSVYKKNGEEVYIFGVRGTTKKQDVLKCVKVAFNGEVSERVDLAQMKLQHLLLTTSKDAIVYVAGHSLGAHITGIVMNNLTQNNFVCANETGPIVRNCPATILDALKEAKRKIDVAYLFNPWNGLFADTGKETKKLYSNLRADPMIHFCRSEGDIATKWCKNDWKTLPKILDRRGSSATYLKFQGKPWVGGHSIINFPDEVWRLKYMAETNERRRQHKLPPLQLSELGFLPQRGLAREPRFEDLDFDTNPLLLDKYHEVRMACGLEGKSMCLRRMKHRRNQARRAEERESERWGYCSSASGRSSRGGSVSSFSDLASMTPSCSSSTTSTSSWSTTSSGSSMGRPGPQLRSGSRPPPIRRWGQAPTPAPYSAPLPTPAEPDSDSPDAPLPDPTATYGKPSMLFDLPEMGLMKALPPKAPKPPS